ncbi:MAG TPA: hypothetical protein DCS60_06545 [Opitutae bacterium]|nr:hypothetical protein [Opitutae bacterium]
MRLFFTFLLGALTATNSLANTPNEETLRKFLDPVEYRSVDISPDGRFLSVIQVEDEINTLVILELATMKPMASVKYGEKGKTKDLDVCCTQWVSDTLLSYGTTTKIGLQYGDYPTYDWFLLAADGSRNDQIWTFGGNYENNSQKRGKLFRGGISLRSTLEDDPDHVLLYFNGYKTRSSLVTMELSTGDIDVVRRLPEKTQSLLASRVTSIPAKSEIDLLISVASRGDEFIVGKSEYLLSDNGGEWTPVRLDLEGFYGEWVPVDISQRYILGIAQKTDAPDAERHIVRFDRETKSWDDAFRIGFASIEGVITDERFGDGNLSRIYFVGDAPKVATFESADKLNDVVASFASAYEGSRVRVSGVTKDHSKAIVSVSSAASLPQYFLYDSKTASASFLLNSSSKFMDNEFSDATYFAYKNSDGITIPGWFQPAKKGSKHPLIVDIHGGPHGVQNSYGFQPYWHILNSLGYSVYAPNFRGSGGYGDKFEEAGYGLWGTGMIDDMKEGAQALIDSGLVDDSQVCAMGGSYGGYGTAQSLVRHADFYDCGIIIAGFFDIEALVSKTDVTESYQGRQYMKAATGELSTEGLRDISPLRNLDKIKAPILLMHGTKDQRTPFKGAEEMVAAMKKAGLEFEHKYYKREGHGNRKMENRIDEWQRIAKFLKSTRPAQAQSTLEMSATGPAE